MPNTHGRSHTDDEMWERLEDWIRIITPVAEEAGVRCGIHPCDPPVEQLGGIPQLFRSFNAYKRLIEIVDSPCNGIEFCQGTFSEMEDAANGGIYGHDPLFRGAQENTVRPLPQRLRPGSEVP